MRCDATTIELVAYHETTMRHGALVQSSGPWGSSCTGYAIVNSPLSSVEKLQKLAHSPSRFAVSHWARLRVVSAGQPAPETPASSPSCRPVDGSTWTLPATSGAIR